MHTPAPPNPGHEGPRSPPISTALQPGADAPAETEAAASKGAASALARMRAGSGNPAELADQVQFLASGSMVHAVCAVVYAAIRSALWVSHDKHPGT